jgi:hypothetical protein
MKTTYKGENDRDPNYTKQFGICRNENTASRFVRNSKTVICRQIGRRLTFYCV